MDLQYRPATMPDLATVAVETLLLGVHAGGLTYRTAQRDLLDGEHPDGVARGLAGLVAGGMLHSTSWRFSTGRIVLTYAALPDPAAATATRLGPPAPIATGAGPLTPSPPAVSAADVVVHACRHLAFLRRTDPVVAAASELQPRLWALLDCYRPGVAGFLAG